MFKRVQIVSVLLLLTMGMAFAVFGSGCDKESQTGNFEIKPLSIQEENKYLQIDVRSPEIKGVPGIERLNEEISTKLDASIAEVKDAAEAIEETSEEFPGLMAGLHGDFQYFHNGDLASLWTMMDNYTGGAHGLYWIDSYTFHTKTGEVYSFQDLFIEDPAGLNFVTEEILKGKSDVNRGFFDDAEATITSYNNDYHYLINGNELVVYFPLYEIAPYAAGIQTFVIPLDSISSFLKPEIAAAMKDQEPVDIPYFN